MTTLTVLLVLATLFIAYANGANDNFKGVATLFGCNAATYRTAITLATIATLAGSVSSVFLAEALIQAFSGKGLIPDQVAGSPGFLLAVATGAGATVILATVLGLPISTTHGLLGALAGAGFASAGSELNISVLGGAFLLPLLASPLIAILLTMPTYAAARSAANRLGIEKESCVCLGPRQFAPARNVVFASGARPVPTAHGLPDLVVMVGSAKDCVQRYSGTFLGITTQGLVDGLHHLSGAAISFARGLNDTPKILGLLLVVGPLDTSISVLAIAAAMAVGGLMQARKVALTMSKKIAGMNDGQALTANLITALLVIFASKFGMPVSTTHVSVGAIAGIGIVNRSARWRMLSQILLSWFLTLPLAAAIAAAVYFVSTRL
jgi:inorganic phosphate transporter, PiT family